MGICGPTKTTLELPDELMRRVKLYASRRNQKLMDAIAQLLELGIVASADDGKSPAMPKPLRLKGGLLTIGDIDNAISRRRN
jgi:hypothetical protein